MADDFTSSFFAMYSIRRTFDSWLCEKDNNPFSWMYKISDKSTTASLPHFTPSIFTYPSALNGNSSDFLFMNISLISVEMS